MKNEKITLTKIFILKWHHDFFLKKKRLEMTWNVKKGDRSWHSAMEDDGQQKYSQDSFWETISKQKWTAWLKKLDS